MNDSKDKDATLSFKGTMPRLYNKKRETVINNNPETSDLEALSAEFRAQIGILEDEEEGTTDEFKNHLGLSGLEEIDECKNLNPIPEYDFMKDPSIVNCVYSKFVNDQFINPNAYLFSTSLYETPLLRHSDELNNRISLSVWIAIQLFLENIKNPPKSQEPTSKNSIMTMIHCAVMMANSNKQGKSSSSEGIVPTKEEMETVKVNKKSSFKKKIFGGMSNAEKSSIKNKESVKKKRFSDSSSFETSITYSTDTNVVLKYLDFDEIELLQFIIGHGVLRPSLRDEIYCQIIKQITGNDDTSCLQKGVILLGLSLACFQPSEKLSKYVKNLVRLGLDKIETYWNEWLRERLKRALSTGPRYHPPGKNELNWVKTRKYPTVNVLFPDKKFFPVTIDSSSTAGELCDQLAKQANIKDTFGFSLYLLIDDRKKEFPRQISSMGSGSDHIMDALTECESIARFYGRNDDETYYRFYYRKEVCSPYYEPKNDPIAMNYMYSQLKFGTKSHEYSVQKESDRLELLAKIIFIDKDGLVDMNNYEVDMWNYVSSKTLKTLSAKTAFAKKLKDALLKEKKNKREELDIPQMKEDLILEFVDRWHLQFSAFFEVKQVSGPPLPQNTYVMGINHKGVYLMNDFCFKEAISFPYYKIVGVSHCRDTKVYKLFTIMLLNGEDYTFTCPVSKNITDLISTFLEGLRRRSKYAIGIDEFSIMAKDGTSFKIKKGDLLLMLEASPNNAPNPNDWVYGQNCANKSKGNFPLDMAYVLPTIELPDNDFMREISSLKSHIFEVLPRRKGKIVLKPTTLHRPKDKRSKLFYSDA